MGAVFGLWNGGEGRVSEGGRGANKGKLDGEPRGDRDGH